MRTMLLSMLVYCLGAGMAQAAQRVAILQEETSPQSAYAARKLRAAITERGYEVKRERTSGNLVITLAAHSDRLGKEAFSITPGNKTIAVVGGDRRGLIYGALALAEMVRNGTRLEDVHATEQRPRLEFRGIK